MSNHLITYVIKNIWCSPWQDKQFIFEPAKISRWGGDWGSIRILDNIYDLPLENRRFFVYQIGQLHPHYLNLNLEALCPYSSTWVKMSDNCIKQKMIVDIYSQKGIQYPRTQVWYRYTENRNLIFAIRDLREQIPGIVLNEEPIFIRFYSNEYFKSSRAMDARDGIHVAGGFINVPVDLQNFEQSYLSYKNRPIGHTYAFVNGYLVSTINPFTAKQGDYVEFVYDSSIYLSVDFSVEYLAAFDSARDGMRKYLLHYAGKGTESIDYQDDIDVFIYKQHEINNRFCGVYMHKNNEVALRMVTHKDYSVPVDYVLKYRESHPDWNDDTRLTIRLHIRKGGFFRPLVFENNRIHELYKLPEPELSMAMVGSEALVENWTASHLENSDYVKLMGKLNNCFDIQEIEDALGYNALSKYAGDAPKAVYNWGGQLVVNADPLQQNMSTGFEFDAAGLLLGYHGHVSGIQYPVRNRNTKWVELLVGLSNDRIDDTFGAMEQTIDPNLDYRMYICDKVNGIVQNNWRDVTENGPYAITGNVLRWGVDAQTKYTLVRSNRTNFVYSTRISRYRGLFQTSILARELHNGVLVSTPMSVPMGFYDVYLNGHPVIEGLDYIIRDNKIITFLNTEYLVNPETQPQDVTIRGTSFCLTDMTRERPLDTGFVNHGLLSRNGRFNIRDDRVLSIFVDGALKDRSELKFAEDDPDAGFMNLTNGRPYQIRDIVVPLRKIVPTDTCTLRAKSKVIDRAVSDYLSLKLPEDDFDHPNVIGPKYEIVSPFFARLIDDMVTDIFDDPRIKEFYDDFLVMELCGPYLELLEVDPITDGKTPNQNYVIIQPHPFKYEIELDPYHFKFLLRALKIYSNGLVAYDKLLKVKPIDKD